MVFARQKVKPQLPVSAATQECLDIIETVFPGERQAIIAGCICSGGFENDACLLDLDTGVPDGFSGFIRNVPVHCCYGLSLELRETPGRASAQPKQP